MKTVVEQVVLVCGVCSLLLGCQSDTSESSKGTEQRSTIVAIVAHPDDEMVAAPVLSRLAREGHRVTIAVVTDGRYGVTDHADIPAGDSLASVRSQELHCSSEALGVQPPVEFGMEDGFSYTYDTQALEALGAALEDLTRLHNKVHNLFERLRPDLVITMNPAAGYGHPDHRVVTAVVTEVYQLGKEHWPRELLYTGMPTERLKSIPEPSDEFVRSVFNNWHGVSTGYLPVRLSYEEQDMANAREAIACHSSQFTKTAAQDLGQIISHVYDGTVTFRPWSEDEAPTEEILNEEISD